MNDDLDEANTDYAESDVMLGGANTSNSNGSNDRTNGNSKLQQTKAINFHDICPLWYNWLLG